MIANSSLPLSLTLRGGGGEEKGKECSLKEERRKIKTSAMRDRSKPKVHSNFPLHTVAEGGRERESERAITD
jgi:hypothetical protein